MGAAERFGREWSEYDHPERFGAPASCTSCTALHAKLDAIEDQTLLIGVWTQRILRVLAAIARAPFIRRKVPADVASILAEPLVPVAGSNRQD